MASYAEQNTSSRRRHDFYRKPENGALHNLPATGNLFLYGNDKKLTMEILARQMQV